VGWVQIFPLVAGWVGSVRWWVGSGHTKWTHGQLRSTVVSYHHRIAIILAYNSQLPMSVTGYIQHICTSSFTRRFRCCQILYITYSAQSSVLHRRRKLFRGHHCPSTFCPPWAAPLWPAHFWALLNITYYTSAVLHSHADVLTSTGMENRMHMNCPDVTLRCIKSFVPRRLCK